MRSFLAYDIAEPSILSRFGELQSGLKATGADLKLVDTNLLHFTVRFLGEITQSQSESIIKALDGAVPSLSFELYFKGMGTFPSEQRISVIWIGCDQESAEALSERAKHVNERLASRVEDLPRGDERFSAHVTIARVRTGRNKENLVRFISSHSSDDFGTAPLGKLKLKRSELSPRGPSYSDLHIFN